MPKSKGSDFFIINMWKRILTTLKNIRRLAPFGANFYIFVFESLYIAEISRKCIYEAENATLPEEMEFYEANRIFQLFLWIKLF